MVQAKQLLFNVPLTSLLTKLGKVFFYMSGRKVSLESSFKKVPTESRFETSLGDEHHLTMVCRIALFPDPYPAFLGGFTKMRLQLTY